MSRANPATTHDNAGIAAWSFKLKAEIHSYEDCEEAIRKLGCLGEATIGPNMTLIERLCADGKCGYAIVLYDTEIIRYCPDGTFSVDSGGWNTPTTMYRLCSVLPGDYSAYFHRKQLGLMAGRLGVLHANTSGRKLWPLDHSKRINIETGELV